jgi:hypothetical protein
MSYKVKGKIKSISDVQDIPNGAKRLSFRIDTGEQYNNIMEFEVYKSADYAEHALNFSKYNAVGDDVEVEFNIKTYNWVNDGKDKIFTTLGCWKVEKLNNQEPVSTEVESSEDLPF